MSDKCEQNIRIIEAWKSKPKNKSSVHGVSESDNDDGNRSCALKIKADQYRSISPRRHKHDQYMG